MLLTKIASCNDIFKDLNLSNETNEYLNVFVAINDANKSEIAHRLLNVIGEHLLSNDENKNMLAQILENHKNSSENFKKKFLDTLKTNLKNMFDSFIDQSPKLETEINYFIKKVLNTIHSLSTRENLDWECIKTILPKLQIFSKQLIDQVTSTF